MAPEYIEINLVDVDLTYKLAPVGDYHASIDTYEFVSKDDGSLRYIKFSFTLIQGIEDGIGMVIVDNIDPNHEVGQKKLKMLAIASNVPFDRQRIDLQPFLGQMIGVKLVHKSGKTADTVFCNISKYYALDSPLVQDQVASATPFSQPAAVAPVSPVSPIAPAVPIAPVAPVAQPIPNAIPPIA